MTVKTMEDLFVETLKDIYYAEKHILKALPGMVKKAGAKQLKEALETHRKETEGQIDRLEEVFKLFDLSPRGIRTHLQLNKLIYAKTSSYGHFGRKPGRDGSFSWEKTDLVPALKAAVKAA